MSRSDSPLINDAHDLSSPTFEHRSLAEIMNLININQSPSIQQQQQHQQQMQAMQAFQLLQQQQQLQHQLSLAAAAAVAQPLLQSQLMNRFNNNNNNNNNSGSNNGGSWRQQQNPNALDHAAKYHRTSAAFYDPSCTWSGVLPPRNHRFITYSPKVFLGGIPWDVSEQTLIQIFKPFGQIKIEWPGKEQNAAQPKGYVYVIFESEKQVKALLQVRLFLMLAQFNI
jgi:cytoplasmic polyadenylation element-binding protein